MSLVRRLRRAVGDTARAIPLAREASARVARRKYAQRVHRFLVEKSGIADPRPDGVLYEAAGALPSEHVVAPLAVEVFTQAIPRRHRGQVNLAGDRPFTRDDILDILEVFRTKGYRCERLATDGTALTPARADALVALAGKGFLQQVSHAIDRPRQVIRGLPPADDGGTGIRTLMQAARHRGEPLRLIADTTVHGETLDALHASADGARDLGADAVEMHHLMFATPDEVDETLRLVGETDRTLIATNITNDPGIPAARVRVQAEALRSRCGALGLHFDQRPEVHDAILDDYYTPGARLDGRCLYPFLHASVSFSGKVLFCPYIRIVVGDLTAQTLAEAWNTPRYTALRKSLLEQQLFPVCRRCCKAELTGKPLPQPVRVFTAPLPAMAGTA